MKILVTGASGFVGRHLHECAQISPLNDEGGQPVDLKNLSELAKHCQRINPDAVIHLAAQSFVPQSFKDPLETFHTNFLGTFNLLQALKSYGFCGRFLYVGSGDVYGSVPVEFLPVSENFPLKPRNPYAVSKMAAEALCYQWSQSENFDIILARPFNQIGPGQSDHFAVSNFAKQLTEIKLQRSPPILEVGDLEVTRDFTDVRDVIAAFLLLLENGKNGEVYNICSNQEISLKIILETLIEQIGLNKQSLTIRQSIDRHRKIEQKRMCGSSKKISSELGWQPRIALNQTLKDILLYWEKSYLCVEKH